MTTRTSDEIKTEMQRTVNLLRTLRDETKVKIHLANMDLKKTWDELQPKLAEAEQNAARAAGQASEATLEAMKSTVQKLKKVADSL
jgi:lipid II:glycine glycyltransferase (peptidoglycan interpeptide bridge formation enzyme)